MIEIKDLVKTYNKGKANAFEALHGVSLLVEDGELTAIMGESGAGKSTLLHIIAGIDSYEEGEYRLDGTLVKGLKEAQLARLRNEKIGIVMQDFALVEDFTALENVLLPLDFAVQKKKNRKELGRAALEEVGLKDLAGKKVNQLSGGQKQRVAIARAMVNEPALLIADEPTGALDSGTSREIMEVFHKLHEQGRTILIVTHDEKVAQECERIVRIEDGRMVAEG